MLGHSDGQGISPGSTKRFEAPPKRRRFQCAYVRLYRCNMIVVDHTYEHRNILELE